MSLIEPVRPALCRRPISNIELKMWPNFFDAPVGSKWRGGRSRQFLASAERLRAKGIELLEGLTKTIPFLASSS
jgi:hypothetical protein